MFFVSQHLAVQGEHLVAVESISEESIETASQFVKLVLSHEIFRTSMPLPITFVLLMCGSVISCTCDVLTKYRDFRGSTNEV